MKSMWKCLIEAAKLKNASLFWQLLSNQTARSSTILDSHISPEIWEYHFQKMYEDPNNVMLTHMNEGLTEWPPVSVTEIKSLIGQLRKGKAPGMDFISAEVLKNNVEWWIPILASLFTYMDNSGRIPEDWGMAIIVPIF